MTDKDEILAAIAAGNAEIKALLDAISTQTGQTEIDVRAIKADVGQLKADVGELRTAVDRIETKLGRHETRIEDVETKVKALARPAG